MPSELDAFFDTLVAAADEASEVLKPSWAAADSVYLDYKPAQGRLGETLDVAIPRVPTGAITNAGTGDITLSATEVDTVPIVLNQHPAGGFPVSSFNQFRTVRDIRDTFLDGWLTEIKNYINRHITSLFNSTNFATNSPLSATGGLVSTTKFLEGRGTLMNQNVPVEDPANMTFLLPSIPYNKMLEDDDWSTAQIAGNGRAEKIREMGVMPVAYGATLKYDQQMPVTGSSPSRTWIGAYFHRWAIALTTRRLPEPDGNVVRYYYVEFGGIPILIEIGYNQRGSGWIVTIHAGYGLAVVRPEMCQLFSIGEGS